MVEKRTEVITHDVLNETTGKWEKVDKTFTYNESPDGKIKYITHQWCVNMKNEYKVGDTFKSDFRNRPETYMYEDAQGNVTPFIEFTGIKHNENELEYTFTKVDGSQFIVLV